MITIFHSLLQSWRWTDFRKLANLIRNNEIDFSSKKEWETDLIAIFIFYIRSDEDNLTKVQLIR